MGEVRGSEFRSGRPLGPFSGLLALHCHGFSMQHRALSMRYMHEERLEEGQPCRHRLPLQILGGIDTKSTLHCLLSKASLSPFLLWEGVMEPDIGLEVQTTWFFNEMTLMVTREGSPWS